MFVMRIASNFSKQGDGVVKVSMEMVEPADPRRPVVLITYKNTQNLPAVRVDEFPSLLAAIDYVKDIEPTCPRLSLDGAPPQPTPSWEEHLAWLHGQGLKSAAEGDFPVPKWVSEGQRGDDPSEVFVLPSGG